MQVIDYLNKKKSIIANQQHPLQHYSYTFKNTYAFGLSVLVYGAKEQLPITLECLSSILNALQVDLEVQDKLCSLVHNHFDLKIQEVFRLIDTRDTQYCFIADLLHLINYGMISSIYSTELIDGFMQVFHFSNAEKQFITSFCSISYKIQQEKLSNTVSYIDTKDDIAIELYQTFTKSGYTLPPSVITYIYPDFSLDTTYRDLSIKDGGIHQITSNTYIDGNISICNSSTLILDHASAWINGTIHVNSGKLIIRHSDLHLSDHTENYAILVEDSPTINIEASSINCQNKTSFLHQKSGHLKIQQSSILNTSQNYGLTFSGTIADISTTSFIDCQNGAIKNMASQEFFLGSCHFENCNSIHGGAIYSNSTASSTIYNCHFENCHAKYIGGAIYFAQLRYGQSVMQCTHNRCSPEDSVFFNHYERI